MSYRSATLVAAIAAMLALVGCGPSENPASSVSNGTSAAVDPASVTAAPLKSPGGMMTATPGQVSSCNVAAVVRISWATTGHDDVEAVEVMAGDGADAKTFAAGGATGEAETGPWVLPGAVFVLRNAADGTELDRLTMQGPSCMPAAAPAPEAEQPAPEAEAGAEPAPAVEATGVDNAPGTGE